MHDCACAHDAPEAIDLTLIDPILERHAADPGALIPVLQETQETLGYLPREALEAISSALSIPFAETYGVATFYTQFHLEPRGRTIIRICHGTACHVRGAGAVTDAITGELGVGVGETAEDLSFTIESVACVGCCGLAPVVLVDDQMYGNLDSKSARGKAKALKRAARS